MVKYRRISKTRPKAFPGESLVAAGIGATATLAGAAISAAATTAGAKRQALAQQQAAQTQAEALKKQNDNANKLQEKSIEFTKKENEQSRDLQNQIQMNLQMLQGQQNENARLDAARIQVKKGGNPLRYMSPFLQGSYNMPFSVTDGGYAMPLGITPQGFGLYELRGDNHEQYHKTKGGKYKSGVGIKGATGQVVEGEGGKRNTQGELIMTTPDDIKFISKHSIKGFNPTQAVMNGMDPVDAYNTQEEIKAISDYMGNSNKDKFAIFKKNAEAARAYLQPSITDYMSTPFTLDDIKGLGQMNIKKKNGGSGIYIKPENRGKFTALQERTSKSATWFKENGTPAQRKMATFALNARKWNHGRSKEAVGGSSILDLNSTNPINFNTDTIAPTIGGVEYLLSERDQAKCGGRMKRVKGGNFWINPLYNPAYTIPGMQAPKSGNSYIDNTVVPSVLQANTNYNPNTDTRNRLTSSQANFIGAGVTGLSNILGAGITSIGNSIASRYAMQGLRGATDATIEGARRLHGIDPNLVKRSDYAAAHAMVGVRDPNVNLRPQLTGVERALQRQRTNIGRGSLSSAAALNRYGNAETTAYDMRSKIYDAGNKVSESIKQANQDAINKAAMQNAAFDNQAGQQYLQSKLQLAEYNNDIANQKIGIEYGAKANLASGLAGIRSNRAQSNAQNWAATTAAVGSGFGDAFLANAKNENDTQLALLGASDEAYNRWVSERGTDDQLINAYNMLKNSNPTDASGRRQLARLEYMMRQRKLLQ